MNLTAEAGGLRVAGQLQHLRHQQAVDAIAQRSQGSGGAPKHLPFLSMPEGRGFLGGLR